MNLTPEAIQRLNLIPYDMELMQCWSYKVADSGEGSNGIYIYNHTTLDYEPFPDNMCRVYNIKRVQLEGRNYPNKVAVYFDATIEFINDTDLSTLQKILDDIPWPEL